MELELIIGRSKTGKSTYIFNQINEKLKNNDSDNLILIVPEQTTYSSEFDLIENLKNNGIMKAQILSFKRLAYKIFEEVGGLKVQELNEYGKIMLAKQVFDEYFSELKVYKKASKKEGFLKEFIKLIKELKENNISPEILRDTYENNIDDEILKRKIFDIVCIYENLEEKTKNKYYDSEDKIELFIKNMEKSQIIKNSSIWIDNFNSFTGQRLRIISELLRLTKKVTIVLNLDPNSLNNLESIEDWENFQIAHSTYKKLKEITENMGAKLKITYKESRFSDNNELNFFERNMFSVNSLKYTKNIENIIVNVAMNPYTECEIIAREITTLVRDNGYRWRDITIAVGDMDRYGINIDKVFSQYKIPYFIDEKRNIMNNALVRLILSVLKMFIRNFRYDDVFEYLKSGFTEYDNYEIDKLENFALQYGVEGGKWFKEFQFKVDNIDYFESLRSRFSKHFKSLRKEFNKLDNAENITVFIFNILENHKVQEKIELWVDEHKRRELFESAYENTQIWNVVMDIFDQIIVAASNVNIKPRQYLKILEAGLREIKVGIIPPTIDKVGIGGIDRASTRKSKVLFVMGVNEGLIPSINNESGILLDEEKDMLSNLGIDIMSGSTYYRYKENHTIYMALAKPDDKIFFSYSISSVEGKALQPSIYIDKIKEIFPLIKVRSEITQNNDISYVSTSDGSISYMIDKIRSSVDGDKIDDIWKDVYGWYDRNNKEIKNIVEKSIIYNNYTPNISKKNVRKLYKSPLKVSASKLENFSECPFKLFVNMGLKPDPRRENKIEYYDIGDIFHKSVEEFTNYIANDKLDISNVKRDEIDKLMGESVDKVLEIKKSENNALEANARNKYMKNKIKRLGNRAAWTIVNQINKGNFKPFYNELKFSSDKGRNTLPPIEIKHNDEIMAHLIGRVDRIDAFQDEDKSIVNIIDYKTGNKDLSLDNVMNGLQLQLFIYLDAILKNGESLFKNKPEIGGVFYFNIDDPLMDGDSIETNKVDNEIFKSLSLKGYVVENMKVIEEIDNQIFDNRASDVVNVKLKKDNSISKTSKTLQVESYNDLLKKVEDIVCEISKQILSGNIDINPFKKNDLTPCSYCPYKAICQFDSSIDGDRYRRIRKMNKDEIIKKLKDEKVVAENDQLD